MATKQLFANVIIGAGAAGLTLGRKLGPTSTVILEKSKGVGGRMATRRDGDYTYDHGAQFYCAQSRTEIDELWAREDLTKEWFVKDGLVHRAADGGISRLAKSLASFSQIRFEEHADKILRSGSLWEVTTKNGNIFIAERLFLTCPLPQTIQLLNASGLAFPSELGEIQYSKALVGLFALDCSDADHPFSALRYASNISDDIYCIANQQSKNVSLKVGLTVEMQPTWSEQHFDQEDSAILPKIQQAFEEYLRKSAFTSVTISKSTLKKWRYSRPMSIAPKPFFELHPGLYVLGDAFGGANIGGAIHSAEATFSSLMENGYGNL